MSAAIYAPGDPPERQKEMLWNKLKEQLRISSDAISSSPANSTINTMQSPPSSSSSCTMNGRTWPTYKEIMDDITNSDYNHVLNCPHDLVQQSRSKNSKPNEKHTKAFCPHGTVCCAKMELFGLPDEPKDGGTNNNTTTPYTGLLTPGQTNECIIRLSSAMKPPAKEQNKFGKFFLNATGGKLRDAKLFPMVALKCFRKGTHSGNLLFAGRKIGQKSGDFFQHCLCTQMTERVPGLLKPFIRKFYSYSENPLSLGVSDFCALDQHGESEDSNWKNHFPYVVMLMPVYKGIEPLSVDHDDDNYEDFDNYIDDLLKVPSGSVLFDVYACPTPTCALNARKIQRIGRIVSTSEMILSTPNDGLFFRHQKREDDYILKPEWREQVKATCSPDNGKTVGTIDRLVGATILESLVKANQFVNFECKKE